MAKNREIFTSVSGIKYEIYGGKYIGYGAWDMSGNKITGGFDHPYDVKIHLNNIKHNETANTTTEGDSRD